MITSSRTKDMSASLVDITILSHKRLFAKVADKFKRHYYGLRSYLTMLYYQLYHIQPNVYNLKVEDVEEFYANDILVHNCPLCFPLEGKKFKIDQIESMIPRHVNCYSKDTEAYTENGWKLIKDIQIGEKCLSAKHDGKHFDFDYIKVKRTIHGFEKTMIHFKCGIFDLLVTPDHDMYVKLYNVNQNIKYAPNNLPLRRFEWEFIKARDLLHKAREYEWVSTDELQYFGAQYSTWNSKEDKDIERMTVEEVEYNTDVYCVELEKNHTLLIRRQEGKEVFCGNCRCVAIPLVDKEAKEAKTISQDEGLKLGDDNIRKGKDALRS